ncbi:unnamed protein product [Thelazia callipaeda]|uniref:Kunitz/Bovine pancreatic trypsin inhibitor domain protein n=1 Tax=Thelazia callipaeda TaxID=103827 RepID=A0A158RCS1_THECL|nr:unnamed protein product [Thelazia callipaeda]
MRSAFQVKWYWDQTKQECKEFHYGGCLGNRNRFHTKQECMKQCIYKMHNPVAIPGKFVLLKNYTKLCLLDANPGFCHDDRKGHWWYYFDAAEGDCRKFFYYGCGGNDNRFYSLYQCRKVCGERLAPKIACDRCDIRTSICVAHSKYNYSCECREGYSKNVFGDCLDIDECRTVDTVCDRNAWCLNTIGSYKCKCKVGYSGDGTKCTYVGIVFFDYKVNFSKSHIAQAGQQRIARNVAHTQLVHKACVRVKLDSEAMVSTAQINVDECILLPKLCHPKAKCHNVEGSYICQCRKGYAGNGYNCTTNPLACMDSFNREYYEQCGNENWREHYYFDHESNRCQSFWYDGCAGTSMNIFSDLDTCEVLCEMTNIISRAGILLLLTLNPLYGMFLANFRLFVTIIICIFHQVYMLNSEICWDLFDTVHLNQCRNGNWEQRFYFDQASMECRMFWYDGCSAQSRNIFSDLHECQWMCEQEIIYKSNACLEAFDEHYQDECNGGRWRQHFYFKRSERKCIPFWYDGCKGKSQNLFQDEASCKEMCLRPATHHRWHHRDKYEKLQRLLKEIKLSNGTESDETTTSEAMKFSHPSKSKEKNYDSKTKVANTFNDTLNTDGMISEFNTCTVNPCKNGATCIAKIDNPKTSYECFCALGFGGIHCESSLFAFKYTFSTVMIQYSNVNTDVHKYERPCDINPCLNNGTCRTTSSYSAFFCDCPANFEGLLCDIGNAQKLPYHEVNKEGISTVLSYQNNSFKRDQNENEWVNLNNFLAIGGTKSPKYGKNVQLLSSGKAEWIEQLKKAKAKELQSKANRNESQKIGQLRKTMSFLLTL